MSADALRDGMELAEWSSIDLWRAALGTGGAFSRDDIDVLLSGQRRATGPEHDVLASALNDRLLDAGHPRQVRYWREL